MCSVQVRPSRKDIFPALAARASRSPAPVRVLLHDLLPYEAYEALLSALDCVWIGVLSHVMSRAGQEAGNINIHSTHRTAQPYMLQHLHGTQVYVSEETGCFRVCGHCAGGGLALALRRARLPIVHFAGPLQDSLSNM